MQVWLINFNFISMFHKGSSGKFGVRGDFMRTDVNLSINIIRAWVCKARGSSGTTKKWWAIDIYADICSLSILVNNI